MTNRTYTTFKIKNFTVVICKKCNEMDYISISKDMPNIRRATLGKEFKSFDEATKAYKNPELKVGLLKIETGLLTSIS